MRLIVHLGFHKTASTYLQSLLNDNRDRLAERGIWYARRPPTTPEHHPAAWRLLEGDASPLVTMLRDGARAGCNTVLLSSEELESILFRADIAALIEQTAADEGVDMLEWDIVVREPGSYFASLHAQLHWSNYVDSLTMFAEVMRKGMWHFDDPTPRVPGRPYWYFCFDYLRHVSGFVERTAAPVFVHDYADREPFPGWRMIDRIGALDALERTPSSPDAQNVRRDPVTVATGFVDRIVEMVDRSELDAMAPVVEDCLRANLAAVPVLGDVVGRRFGDSYQAVIEEFGTAD